MKFFIKQLIKMFFQKIILPVIYKIYAVQPVKAGAVILADAHHESIPFSMRALKQKLDKNPELIVTEIYWNNDRSSAVQILKHMVSFMKAYATAETVVICDNFLPVASCRKRKGTRVIQLWHACGAFKKFGYDTEEDIPIYYKGNVFKNSSLVTVSAPFCVAPFASAMRLPERRVRALGVSRTDLYFSDMYNASCRNQFFLQYPEAVGKKIVLWAPTFRGNPGEAGVQGLREVKEIAAQLQDTHFFVIKLHPHTQTHIEGTNCSIITEELLPIVDVVITDYSSIIFDAMVYRHPIILFVPDYDEYADGRGFYLDFNTIPGIRVQSKKELLMTLTDEECLFKSVGKKYEMFYNKYMGSCDGHATDRIVKRIVKAKAGKNN